MRFCARCGLPLNGVRELVASGGVPAAGSGAGAQSAQLFKSQRGVRRGTWMMLVSFLLALVVGLLSAIEDELAPLLLIPFLCFVAGFVRLLYGVFWEERRARVKEASSQAQAAANPAQLAAPARGTGLPPARVAPVEEFTAQRMKTAEILQPPSVTENTTRLLEDEADANRA